jgi:hypothetical protein
MMLTEQDELAAEQSINEFVRIVHEQRARIRDLENQIKLSNENELFRIRESNALANENGELRTENARLSNNCNSIRLLLIDVESSFSNLFPRLTRATQIKLKPDAVISERPPIRRVAS